jgi:hypothetical protein
LNATNFQLETIRFAISAASVHIVAPNFLTISIDCECDPITTGCITPTLLHLRDAGTPADCFPRRIYREDRLG